MFNYIKTFLASKGIFAPEAKGQGLVEYAILIVLVAAIAWGVATTLGGKVNGLFEGINLGK